MEYLCRVNGTRDVHKSCVLYDIGFICKDKVVKDKNIGYSENDITRMLTELLEVKPDFFF